VSKSTAEDFNGGLERKMQFDTHFADGASARKQRRREASAEIAVGLAFQDGLALSAAAKSAGRDAQMPWTSEHLSCP